MDRVDAFVRLCRARVARRLNRQKQKRNGGHVTFNLNTQNMNAFDRYFCNDLRCVNVLSLVIYYICNRKITFFKFSEKLIF